MQSRFFGGSPASLGQVTNLPVETFAQLVEQHIMQPAMLPLTKSELLGLPKDKQMKAKATDYLVAATFATSPSARRTEMALPANLIFLDIDDPVEAERLLESDCFLRLGNLNSVVYHTARSTLGSARLRVVVETRDLPIASYGNAVNAIAGLLGMSGVTRESQIPVQPMFLPVVCSDATDSPVIHVKTDGERFELGNLVTDVVASPVEPEMGDLLFLRSPLEGLTTDTIADALNRIDADCSMQQWLEIGMGLKHQFGDQGFDVWDAWSQSGKVKYPGDEEVRRRWDSFDGQTKNRAPITIRSVIKLAEEAGWENKAMADQLYQSTLVWIESSARSTEELVDHATRRVAKVASMIGPIKQATLIGALARVYRQRELRGVTAATLTADVKRHIAAAQRASRDSEPPPWANNVVFLTASNLFFRFVDNRKMRPEVVDLIYRSPDPEIRARDYLIHNMNIKVVENLRYDPSTTKRFIVSENCPYINTYRASFPAPDQSQVAEVAKRLIPHADVLFSPKYANVFLDFIAYMVQKPGRKIRWVPVVQSGVGAGKGLWAAVATAALGPTNVQRLSAEHVLEGTYNGWAAGYQLTVLDEIRIVGANRHRVMDKMKPCISDDFVSVRNLYEPVTTVPNVANYLMFTNHHDALAVHDEDRRYFVVQSPLQTAADIRNIGGEPLFEDLYRLVSTHGGGIRAFFEQRKISPDFKPDGRAPVTPYLKQLAQATASPLSSAVQDALDDRSHALVSPDLVSITALRGVMPTDRLPVFTDQGLAAVLREKGFVNAGRHVIEGAKHSLWVNGFTGDPVAEATLRSSVL
jgi:hypothetical protein